MTQKDEPLKTEKEASPVNPPSGRHVLIPRLFDAPRELVFKAWTTTEQLERWYAPTGCTVNFLKNDLNDGGVFQYVIRNPKAKDRWCKGVFQEIVIPKRIVYRLVLTDEQGNELNAADTGMDPEWPSETIVTVTFIEQNGKTRLTLHQTVSESLARRTGAYPGWIEMLDKLEAEVLAGGGE